MDPLEPKSHSVEIPFIPQEKNLCGPTVLKMATQTFLPDVSFETYKNLTFREKAQGTFKSDMLSSTRRLGLTPYKVPTLNIMFNEINHGRPVIVFQNLGLSWYPAWHYALLVGYDSEKNIVYLHSGTDANLEMNFPLFTRTWKRGENWSYVVVPPEIIPPHVSLNEVLDNATVFESLKEKAIAQKIYKSMIDRWPNRFEPHLGLANIFYEDKKIKPAIKEIEIALKLNPKHPALLYNLSVLYHESGDLNKALQYKTQTLAASSAEDKNAYLKKFKF